MTPVEGHPSNRQSTDPYAAIRGRWQTALSAADSALHAASQVGVPAEEVARRRTRLTTEMAEIGALLGARL